MKILEAAARGTPVISTSTGIGSLEGLLGLSRFDSDREIVDASVHLLKDRDFAVRVGQDLYERNAQRWHDQRPHASVQSWLDVEGSNLRAAG